MGSLYHMLEDLVYLVVLMDLLYPGAEIGKLMQPFCLGVQWILLIPDKT